MSETSIRQQSFARPAHNANPLRHGVGVRATQIAAVVLFPISVAPLIWMLLASVMQPTAGLGGGVPGLPQTPRLQNFVEVWQRIDVARMFANSFVVAGLVVAAQLLTSITTGFVLASYRFRGRKAALWVLLLGLIVPDVLTWVPAHRVLLHLGMLDTLAALVVPFAASGFGTLVVYSHIRSIPRELIDASRLEGCSAAGTLLLVVLPLIRPALKTVAIAAFVFSWGSLTWPLLMTHSRGLQTLPIGISLLQDEFATQWHLVMALAVLMAVPPVLALTWLLRGVASLTPSAPSGDGGPHALRPSAIGPGKEP